jgi:hypothetical protein
MKEEALERFVEEKREGWREKEERRRRESLYQKLERERIREIRYFWCLNHINIIWRAITNMPLP